MFFFRKFLFFMKRQWYKMKKDFRNRKGQGMAVEYALTFFLVVSFVIGMSAYVRRAIQGRVRDSRDYMIGMVRDSGYTGNLYYEYEPYYGNSDAVRAIDSTMTRRGMGTYPQPSGIFELEYDTSTTTRYSSNQAAPGAAADDI